MNNVLNMTKRKTYTTKGYSKSKKCKKHQYGPLGEKVKVTWRYAERFQLNPSVGGTPSTRNFSANGCHDPDINIGGHQPRGFDQLMSLYDHGVVTESRIKVWADNNGEEAGQVITVTCKDTNATPIDFKDLLETGGVNWTMLANKSGGTSAKMVTDCVKPLSFLGRGFSDPEMKFSIASNPDEMCFWQISAFPGNEGDSEPVNVVMVIEYDCWLIEPKLPTIS